MNATTLSAQEARQRLAAGEKPLLLDVRTPGEYASGHVPGAINTPLGSPAFAQAVREASSSQRAVWVLCQSGGRARRACSEIDSLPAAHVAVIDGGTSGWAQAGGALERAAGRATISLERQVRIAAGALVVTGVALGWFVHAGFFGLAAFVGAGLVFAGVTDFCGMGLLLAKMPWNR